MRMRCPYNEPRDVPWIGRTGDRAVEPDEIVDIPAELVDNFAAAGWTEADAPAPAAPAAAKKQSAANAKGDN